MSQSLALRKRYAKWRVDLAIHEAIERARATNAAAALQGLVVAVRAHSTLLRPLPVGGYAGWRHAPKILESLLALTEFRKQWLRDAGEWSGPCGPALVQFGSLARHLLATHPVPEFLTHVWFEEGDARARDHRKLYRHLGLGNSIRGADVPLKLTRPMEEFFHHAPSHYTVEQALRWSQVRGLGGSRELASRVALTRLGSSFQDHAFWNDVLARLARETALETDLVPALVEVLHRRRGRYRLGSLRDLAGPNFVAFQEQVRTWAQTQGSRRQPKRAWAATAIPGFDWCDGSDGPWSYRQWTIRELLDSDALTEEGAAQRHCVATYAAACKRRATSIWSLRCHGALKSHRVLTVEVDPHRRRIVTALGHCNRRPRQNEYKVLTLWANHAGLEIDEHVKRYVR